MSICYGPFNSFLLLMSQITIESRHAVKEEEFNEKNYSVRRPETRRKKKETAG